MKNQMEHKENNNNNNNILLVLLVHFFNIYFSVVLLAGVCVLDLQWSDSLSATERFFSTPPRWAWFSVPSSLMTDQ